MDKWSSNKLPERLPFSKKKLPKKVIFSYILDYVIIVALIALFFAIDKIPPFHQPFSLENYTLHYPFAVKERVPVFNLCLYCVAAPAAIIAFYTLVIDGIFSHQTTVSNGAGGLRRLTGRYRLKDRLWELNCGILGLGLSVCAAFVITGALKNAIGKPRPDLIDRCRVDPKIFGDKLDKLPQYLADNKLVLSTFKICTQTDNYILNDGFKSFPSGHSSSAFAGLFYLSLYLAAKLHVLDFKGEVWKSFIVLVPTLGAALIAGTRIMDARHHPFDVLSGSLMGILVAWGSYRQYFPPVSETWRKGRAYPIRTWGLTSLPPGGNPTIQVDEDTQPLRPLHLVRDLEQGGSSSGYSSHTAVAGGSDDHNGNVFRQQIHDSQRRRQGEGRPFVIPHTDTAGSTLSAKVSRYQNQLPGSNPFANDGAHGPRGQDPYDYSSSDEDENYELQNTYRSNQHASSSYNPISGPITDTGYHPHQGISLNPTPPPPSSGDIGETHREGPVVPPHAAGTTS